MNICEHCNELLLDYLFDLLDQAEAETVRSHLEQCPACRSQLDLAQKQQNLMARAAQVYLNVPTFKPPVPVPAQLSSADTLPLAHDTIVQPIPKPAPTPTPQRRKPLRLYPWVGLAASLLIATIAGLGYYQHGLMALETEYQIIRQEVKKVDIEYASLLEKYTKQVNGLPKKLQLKQLQVNVTGSAVYNPQTENPVFISTKNLAGQPEVSDVTVRLTDEKTNKVLYEKKIADTSGQVSLNLPANLKSESGAELKMIVETDNLWDREKVAQKLVVASPSYLTQVVTSKPLYESGELLFFRTLTLDQFTLQPPKENFDLSFSLVNSQGQVVKKLVGQSQSNGIAGGEFALTEDIPAGRYTLQVEELAKPGPAKHYLAPQSCSLLIRQPQNPQVVLDRDKYYPGQIMNFQFQGGFSPQGNALANQPLTITLRVKDESSKEIKLAEVRPEQFRADEFGNVEGKLIVPKDLPPKAEAEVEIQVHDGKGDSKFIQPVPLVDPKWDVSFFPEGGDLVVGVPNRVYCQVHTPGTTEKFIHGELLDVAGNAVASVKLSPHQHKAQSNLLSGSFSFTPEKGQNYKLRVYSGANIPAEKTLPAARVGGLALHVANPVTVEDTPVQCTLYSNEMAQPVLVVATCRGQVVGQQLASAKSSGTDLSLSIIPQTRGVIRLTVYQPREKELVPLAERLLYRSPATKMNLSFSSPQEVLEAGQKAQLWVKSETETRKPADGYALALIVEEGLAFGKNKQGKVNLPAFFYLTSKLRNPDDLENANILVGTDPTCCQALDRFLGIQGWRTFVKTQPPVSVPVDNLTSAKSNDGAMLFCLDNLDRAQTHYEEILTREMKAIHEQLAEQRQVLQKKKQENHKQVEVAWLALHNYQTQARDLFGLGIALFTLLALAIAVVLSLVGTWRLVRGKRTALNPFMTSFACLALALMLFLGSSSFRNWQPSLDGSIRQELALKDLPDLPELPQANHIANKELAKLQALPNEIFIEGAIKELSDQKAEYFKKKQEKKNEKGTADEMAKKALENEFLRQQTLTSLKTYSYQKKNFDPLLLKQLSQNAGLEATSTKRFQQAWQLQEQITQNYFDNNGFTQNPTVPSVIPTGQLPTQGTSGPGKKDTFKNPGVPQETKGASPGGIDPQKEKGKDNTDGKGKGGDKSPLPIQYPTPGLQTQPPGLAGFGGNWNSYERAYFFQQNQQELGYADTLLWHPDLLLQNGNAVVNFDLPYCSAVYRVFLLGHDQSGRLGYYEGSLEVQAK